MSVLIVQLPATPDRESGACLFVQSRDGQSVTHQGHATLAALPAGDLANDVVLVLPAAKLSWHHVELPKGALRAGPARLRAVLEGLLEDRLLDEPDALHFAVSPEAREGQAVWVAVCDRAWLKSAVAALEAAGRAVSRIVPEVAPLEPAAPGTGVPQLAVVGEAGQARLVLAAEDGVWTLPVSGPAWAVLPLDADARSALTVTAEPAVVAQAEQLLGRPVTVQAPAQRCVLATQTAWDMAQFDLANGGGRRAMRRVADGWRAVWFAPAWSALRWGVLVLVLAQIAGLNAWAWRERQALDDKRSEIRSLLTQTFPGVRVVVDAPVQMSRELALLRQASGALSAQDLEPELSALGKALAGVGPKAQATALTYQDGELKIQGLDATTEPAVAAALDGTGYSWAREGSAAVLRARVAAAGAAGGTP